jgi:hypothetical protein
VTITPAAAESHVVATDHPAADHAATSGTGSQLLTPAAAESHVVEQTIFNRMKVRGLFNVPCIVTVGFCQRLHRLIGFVMLILRRSSQSTAVNAIVKHTLYCGLKTDLSVKHV